MAAGPVERGACEPKMTKSKKNLLLVALPLLAILAGVAGASSGADLVVETGSATPTRALAGEQIAVTVRARNAGGLTAGASRLKYYFSSDALLDGSDSYLNYDDVPALAAGTANDETANVRVPAGTPDGSWFVLAIADYDGDVLELDETNNVFAIAITVGDAPLAEGPDLVVEGAALSAARAYPDEVVASSCIVRNAGTQPATVESRLKYYLSSDRSFDGADTYLNYDAVDPLSSGAQSVETANLRVPGSTADGLYYVLFVADSTALIAETDEANVFALPLLVGDYEPRADLALEHVSIPDPEVRPGETLMVSGTVINAGFADAPSTRLVYYLSTDPVRDASDRQLSYDSVDALAPGGSSPEDAALRVTTATPAGAYFLLFVLDADGVVVESDESNDVVAVPVTVVTDDPYASKADFVLGSPSIEVSGDQVTAFVTIENDGVVSSGASRLKYYLSTDPTLEYGVDTYLNYDNVGELSVGATSRQSATFTLGSTGSWFVLFVADANDDVAERYESNNVLAVALDAGTTDPGGPTDDPDALAPDLMVTGIAVDSAEVSAGTRASLRCVVENAGDYDAGASVVKYYLSSDARFDSSDDYLGYDNVPALTPAASSAEDVTPMIPSTTRHGRWYLLAVADAPGAVTETFESNNVAAIAIDVTVDDPTLDAPDLAAASPRLDRAVVGVGRKLDVTVSVANLGTVTSSAARVKYYLSRDRLHDESDTFLAYRDIRALSVGTATGLTADVRIPMPLADGAAYVLVVVDSERAVVERYESNNVLAVPFTIGEDEAPPPSYPYACPASVFTDTSLLGRHTVATLNTLHLGYVNEKDMPALACIASHFDLLGLEEVEQPEGVAQLELEVERLTGEAWSSHVSPHAVGNDNGREYYGFLWRDAEVTMTAALGFYPDAADVLKREPYGASFRMGAFDFSYVVFHLQYGQTISTRRAEAAELANVYAYFQAANGSESDVLIGGDFNLAGNDPAFTLVGVDGISYVTDPEQRTSIGTFGLANSFDNIFYTASTRELYASGAHDYTMANWSEVVVSVTDHIPVWAAFDTSSDDD